MSVSGPSQTFAFGRKIPPIADVDIAMLSFVMATPYHGEIRDHLDKNFPFLVVSFNGAGHVTAEIPARTRAKRHSNYTDE
jgi:hypothetical protein